MKPPQFTRITAKRVVAPVVVVLALLLLEEEAHAWSTVNRVTTCHPHRRHISGVKLTPLTVVGSAANSNDAEENPNSENEWNKRGLKQTGHLGGRSRRGPKKQVTRQGNALLEGIKQWSFPVGLLLALVLFVKGLFGGGEDPSYRYYQSSVYESRVYDSSSGKIQTSRKESVQSNIPGLLEGARSSNKKGETPSSSYLLRPSPDEKFEEELNALMDFRQTLFTDFY